MPIIFDWLIFDGFLVHDRMTSLKEPQFAAWYTSTQEEAYVLSRIVEAEWKKLNGTKMKMERMYPGEPTSLCTHLQVLRRGFNMSTVAGHVEEATFTPSTKMDHPTFMNQIVWNKNIWWHRKILPSVWNIYIPLHCSSILGTYRIWHRLKLTMQNISY